MIDNVCYQRFMMIVGWRMAKISIKLSFRNIRSAVARTKAALDYM